MRRRNAKAPQMLSGAEILSDRRLERPYKPHINCREPLANPRQTARIYTVRSTTKRRKPPARK